MIYCVKIAAFLLCLLGSAFFSGMETGIISLNNIRLRHLLRKRNRNAQILGSFLENPDRLLGTLLLGNNLFNISCSVIMASLFIGWLGARGAWIAGPVTTLVVLIFGEYLPKSFMAARPSRRALPAAQLLRFAAAVLGPFERVATKLAGLAFPVPAASGENVYKPITRDDLVHLTHSGHKTGRLSSIENRMINAVFALKGKTCGDIMVPRKKMAYCHIDTPARKILEMARRQSFNRFPVYQPESDSFVGIIYIFDLLKDKNMDGKTAADYLLPPQFIAVDTPVDQVIPRMRLTRQPFLMVTDSHKRDVVGIIALNEILRRIV